MQIDFAEVRGDQVFIILCLSQYKKMVQKYKEKWLRVKNVFVRTNISVWSQNKEYVGGAFTLSFNSRLNIEWNA